MRDGTTFDDIRDEDAIKIAAARTFDQDKIWSNPDNRIPLEKAHLYAGKGGDDPQAYERLCVDNDEIAATGRTEPTELDPSMIEYLLETPIEEWNSVSLSSVTRSMGDQPKKRGFDLYLQTRPEQAEKHKIKEIMLEQMRTERKFKNRMPVQRNSMLSLLSGDSHYSDSQLSAYARAIENIKKPGQALSTTRFRNDTGGSGMLDI